MRGRLIRFLCAVMSCVPLLASAADGFFKALSNNVVWTDSAQWTNGAPASGENARATIFATNIAFTVNLAEPESPWVLGKFDNKNGYNSFVTLKGGEFLLRGSPAELRSDPTTQFYIKSRLSVESNLLVSGMFLLQNTNRFNSMVNIRAPGGLFFDFPGGQSTLPNLQGIGFSGFSSAAGGTLTVTNPASFAGGSWYIGNGTLRTVKAQPTALTDTNYPPLLVASPLLRLDASRTDSFTFTNNLQVLEWRDLSGNGYHARAAATNNCPMRLDNELGVMPAVDFGTFGSGRYMTWAATLSTVRSVFWVIGSQNGGGFLLGGRSVANFHRGGNLGGLADDPIWGYNSVISTSFLNGQSVNGWGTGLSGGYDLVSVVHSSDLTADGLAFDRTFGAGRSGGQRLAELIIYDRMLSDTERRQVERYLYDKWLAKTSDLRHVQVVTDATLQTASTDSDTTVRKLQGRGKLTKTGAGTLRLEESSSYPGTLRLAEGTLALTNAAPSAASGQVAATPAFHLDASALNTLTLTNDRVYAWSDADGKAISAMITNVNARPPALIRNAMNGLPVVDFGSQYSRQFLDWSQRITGIATVFWVYGSQNNGGFLLCESDVVPTFHRGGSPYRSPDWIKLEAGLCANSMTTWVDGRLCDTLTTPMSGGYQIISARCSSFAASRIGLDRAMYDRSGGMRLAELIIYTRTLTEQERLDTEAALRAKWMPARPALATLEVAGNVVLRAENDLSLDTLTGTGTVTKTGPGKVTLNGLASFTGSLGGDGGAFVLKSLGAAPTQPLAGYAAWFDAARTNTMTIDAATLRVTRWEDASNPSRAATNGLSKAPLLVSSALNALPVVDFDVTGSGRYLVWTAPTGGLRTVFMVLGSQNGGGFLLGSSINNALFSRANNNIAASPLFDAFSSDNSYNERERMWLSRSFAWIDGVSVFPNVQGLSGGYQLVSFLTGGDISVDGFAHNGAGGSTGGQRLAEVIVYDKPLADTDRKTVEAYLSAKWFNRAVHGYIVPSAPTIPGLTLANAATFELGAGQTNSVGWLTGAGSLVKSGTGTLDIAGSTVGFSGTLNVREGVLRYTAGAFGATTPVTNQLVINLDASQTNTLTLDINGKATEWRDPRGNGRYASAPGQHPTYYADAALGGRRTVDFGTYGNSPHMMLDRNIPDARSVFWVLGSQNGGGFLLGNTNVIAGTQVSNWHRGARVDTALEPVTTENRLYGFDAVAQVTTGRTYIDGVLLPNPTVASNVLNGAYQVIETHTTGNASVDAIAADRPTTIGNRNGGQRLAELMIFNRPISDDERVTVEAYLSWKWFGRATPRSLFMPTAGAAADTVRVAAGATLGLGGFTQNTRALVGGGTVSGGSLAVTGLVDLSDPDAGTLTVNGDLALAAGVTVQVNPGRTVDVNGTLTIGGSGLIEWPDVLPAVGATAIFTYDTLVGANNLALWHSVDPAASRFYVRAYASAGTVYVAVLPKGTLFLVN
jgi:autotransporter-associated beta strand protein